MVLQSQDCSALVDVFFGRLHDASFLLQGIAKATLNVRASRIGTVYKWYLKARIVLYLFLTCLL